MSQFVSVGAALRGSRHLMQDMWGSHGSLAWVLDGATRLDAEQNQTAARWVSNLSRAIEMVASARAADLTLSDLLASAINSANLGVQEHPSATVAMARFSVRGLETLVLGDAAVLVGNQLIQDNRLQYVAADVRSERRAAKKLGEMDRAQKLHAELLAREAEARNISGGFWVASDDPNAAYEALAETFVGCRRVLLMTDGVANEMEREFGDARTTWNRLGSRPGNPLVDLRARVLARDGRVDDMALVRHSWIS